MRFVNLEQRLGKSEPEVLHYSVMAVMWSIIEINISIIVVNIPALMPILDWGLDIVYRSKKNVDEYMARASHGSAVTKGMILQRENSRERISSFELELEDRPAIDSDGRFRVLRHGSQEEEEEEEQQQPDHIETAPSSNNSFQGPTKSGVSYRIINV